MVKIYILIKRGEFILKKGYIFLGLGIFLAAALFVVSRRVTAGANTIPSVIRSSAVFATAPHGAVMYDGIGGNAVNLIVSGGKVEILKDRSGEWYYVRYKNRLGWVKGISLDIPPDMPTNTAQLSDTVIINYANSALQSKTPHFIWVDIDRQRVYILNGSKGNWAIEKRIVCSTGRNKTPTTRGFFETSDKGEWFYTERLKSGAMYWTRFNDSYLFHSLAMDKNKNVTDNILGRKRSSGCVRMSVEDAKWFYENIERGSGVWVY